MYEKASNGIDSGSVQSRPRVSLRDKLKAMLENEESELVINRLDAEVGLDVLVESEPTVESEFLTEASEVIISDSTIQDPIIKPVSRRISGSVAIAAIKYLEGSESNKAYNDSFPHQAEALTEVFNELYFGRRRGYVEMPTSTGKTFVMAKLAEAFYDEGLRVLMLAQTVPQATQLLGEESRGGLAKFAPSIKDEHIGRQYQGKHASPDSKVVISTYASMNRFAENGELGEFDVILADEAHRSLGEMTSQNLNAFCPNSVKIGFTATPSFSAEKRVDSIFERPFHSIKLKEAIESDLVAPVTSLIYTTGEEIEQFDYLPEFSPKELQRLITLKSRNDAAVEFARNFVAEGRQGIIACVPGANQAHARALADEIDGSMWRDDTGTLHFIRAAAVGSFLNHQERQDIMARFESGQIDVLTFVNLLSEGWDSQKASFLIDTCPSTSRVVKTQRLGRVLRRKIGNLESIVVDFLDSSNGKMQVTTLDVLEEKYFRLGKTHGSGGGGSSSEDKVRTRLEQILNSELWVNLLSSDSELIQNLRLKFKSGVNRMDPVFALWEKRLREQGLPAEAKNSMGVPQYKIKEVGKFMLAFARKNGELPTPEEITDYNSVIGTVPDIGLAALALTGFEPEPSGLARDYENAKTADNYVIEDEIHARFRSEMVQEFFEALPAREAKILRLRFGIEDGEEWTLERIGQLPDIDVTRDRVRQLEGQGLTRLASLHHLDFPRKLTESKRAVMERRRIADSSPMERFANQRIAFLDHRLHTAKLHAIRIANQRDPTVNTDMPSKDEVAYQRNLTIFIKRLYSLDSISMARIENSTMGLRDTRSPFTEDKIETWIPYGFETAAQKAELLEQMSKYIDYNPPKLNAYAFNKWLRLAIVASKNRIKTGNYGSYLQE